MQKILFVRSDEVIADLQSKGYTVYASGQSPRDGYVETVNGEGPNLVRLLNLFGAEPELVEARTKIPECLSDGEVDLLIDWCRCMGYAVRREAEEIVGDERGISRLGIRFADIRQAAKTGATVNAIGA